jgi:hypothetical protein
MSNGTCNRFPPCFDSRSRIVETAKETISSCCSKTKPTPRKDSLQSTTATGNMCLVYCLYDPVGAVFCDSRPHFGSCTMGPRGFGCVSRGFTGLRLARNDGWLERFYLTRAGIGGASCFARETCSFFLASTWSSESFNASTIVSGVPRSSLSSSLPRLTPTTRFPLLIKC